MGILEEGEAMGNAIGKRLLRMVIVASIAALATAAIPGCASGPQGSSASQSATASSAGASSSAEAVVGGWHVPDEAQPVLTAEEKAVYDAAEGADASVEPMALLATQVVSGLNYAYLGKDSGSWYVLVCYKNTDGKVILTSTKTIDLANVKTVDEGLLTDVVGGWTVPLPETAATLPDDAQAAFDKAQQGYSGVGFAPIALFGTQVVAGTNYLLLCDGTKVVQNPAAELYVVKVCEDLQGNAEIASAEPFDLLYYIGN